MRSFPVLPEKRQATTLSLIGEALFRLIVTPYMVRTQAFRAGDISRDKPPLLQWVVLDKGKGAVRLAGVHPADRVPHGKPRKET